MAYARPNMRVQRTRRPSLRSGRSRCSLGSPLTRYPLEAVPGKWCFRAASLSTANGVPKLAVRAQLHRKLCKECSSRETPIRHNMTRAIANGTSLPHQGAPKREEVPAFRIATVMAILALGAAPLAAQGIPFDSEFVVNTYTTSVQSSGAIASDGTGRFVVVWASYQDGSKFGVYGQRFDESGSRTGPEFLVNTYTTAYQMTPSVATDPLGRFVVVWSSLTGDQDGSDSGVFGQRFDSAGTMLGGEFQVNTYSTGGQFTDSSRAVAVDRAGDFVVVWSSVGQDGDGSGVFGQRFDATGAKIGAEFPVNTTTTDDQRSAAIAMSPVGEFVVVWESYGQDGNAGGIFGQRFDSAGNKLGPEFEVNTYTTGYQSAPSVAMGSRGDFVVIWTSFGQDGSSNGVFGQRFDSAGGRLGPEIAVNTYTTGEQDSGSVAIDSSGSFLVVWSNRTVASDFDVIAQQFDRSGARVGSEFQVNAYTTYSQTVTSVASDGLGFVIAWDSDQQDHSTYGVVARRQQLVPQRVFVDTDEVAGTSSDHNGVLEPGETVLVSPQWMNVSGASVSVSGKAVSFTGPPFNAYLLDHDAADYGEMPAGSSVDCFSESQECYVVTVRGTRPSLHWDTSLQENLSTNGGKTWTIHVGRSFVDVSSYQPFYRKIETVLHAGITSGCGGQYYCPSQIVPRDQMAIFVAKAIAGDGDHIPYTGRVAGSSYTCSSGGHSIFTDVAPTDSFCKHVHYLASQNVTLGCDATHYCPSQTITRDAMASFIAKATLAPDGGAAVPVTYTDATTSRSYSCEWGSPNLHFTDVSSSSPFCKHIHYLWAKGIVDGCSATTYCPGQPVTRDAMAKFLVNAFGLELYGP